MHDAKSAGYDVPSVHASDDGQLQAQRPASEHGTLRNGPDEADNTFQQQPATKIGLLLSALLLTMFLVALDRTIISTAIPQITDDFNSLDDVGWYGSAYLLTCCAFQLQFGKIYTYFPIKITFLTSILLFEVGSAVCGAAPTSSAFIVGRAISGIGAAGIFAGSSVAVVYAVPLQKRPKIQGAFGGLFGLASIVGPMIGGAFTSNVSWRWCFYINLPIGAVSVLAIILFLKIPDRETTKIPLSKKLRQLDTPGTLCLIPAIVCLVLALQLGGQTYAWDDGRIIALLTVMSVLSVAFVAVQIFFSETALVPPRIFVQRSILSGWWQTFNIGACQYVIIYFLPIWFQTIKGASASESGIDLLPTMISLILAAMFAGLTIEKVGYYTLFSQVGVCIMCIGAGLLYTLQASTGQGKWIGYQILYGFGMGLSFGQPNIAAQTVLLNKDAPTGIALMFFAQLLGAAIFVPVGENVLASELLTRLSGIPGVDSSLVTSNGITSLIHTLPADMKQLVLVKYNEALRQVFVIALVLACLSVIGAFGMEYKSVLAKHGQSAEAIEARKVSGEKSEQSIEEREGA